MYDKRCPECTQQRCPPASTVAVVTQPFSQRVTSVEWRRNTESWIGERLFEQSIHVTGPIEQPRVRPWSTQLTVPTSKGTVWFKANCATMSHEPAVHAMLAGLDGAVEPALAVDAGAGWMLTLDGGSTLAAAGSPSVDDWCAVIGLAARLQQAVAPRGDALIGAGLPDRSPATVPQRFDEMVRALSALPSGHPSRLDSVARRALNTVRGRVDAAARALAGSGVPTTLQHGDLHPGNVLAGAAGLRLFDFGDAQWAHALEILVVPMAIVGRSPDVEWPSLWEAYAEEWTGVASRVDMERLLAHAAITHAVNRTSTWLGAIAEATSEELADWGEAPLRHLHAVLDPV